nr:hypothetical protein [Pirellula sp.]
ILTLLVLFLALVLNCAAWVDFTLVEAVEAHDRWDAIRYLWGADLFLIDEFSAPLLMLTTLHSLLTVLATLRTKMDRVPYSGILWSQGLTQGIFCTKAPWLLMGFMALSVVPPLLDLLRRGKPVRVFVIHMSAHIGLMWAGWGMMATQDRDSSLFLLGGVLLVLSVLIRSGIAPFHCWVTDLFEHASFGTAILFVTPMAGAYAAVRLIMPVAPAWSLQWLALVSVLTSVYAAGMAMVQRESRRFYCYLFLSHASLVLVGLETVTPEALTGALCVWFSSSLSLTGFGLTLRSVEARLGRLSLKDYHGLYEHMPNLAALFLITGLAAVGFPGTIGFVSSELLVDGVIHVYPGFGFAIVLASALNGISILATYFKLFTGTRYTSTISLQSRLQERVAVVCLLLIMIGGGIWPQPFISSRQHAAEHLIQEREERLPEPAPLVNGSSEGIAEAESETESDLEASWSMWHLDRRVTEKRLSPASIAINNTSAYQERKGPTRNRDATSDH